jgi:hypothetical protein
MSAGHVLQRLLEDALQFYPMPLLLVVLLHRVMGITPEQLLARLQDKAARMGDPNPWLVQVRWVGRESAAGSARRGPVHVVLIRYQVSPVSGDAGHVAV